MDDRPGSDSKAAQTSTSRRDPPAGVSEERVTSEITAHALAALEVR